MKLDIEALAKEAGFTGRQGMILTVLSNKQGVTRTVHSNGSFVVINDELEDFARLIVERCAEECDGLSFRSDRPYGSVDCSAAIRNLLED